MVTSSDAGPVEGTAWRPCRSGNAVSWDGSAVVKRHASGPSAGLREVAILSRLGDLPVPRLRPGTRAGALRLGYVAGVPAAAAIDAGLGSRVLRAMGDALRSVQRVDPSRFGVAAGIGVVIHGDFAPYNVIVSEDGTEVRAILDWEAAHVGDPLVDLAWCEWQFQRLFPRHGYALPQLFAGFGGSPPRAALDEALRTRMSELSQGAIAPLALAPPRFHATTFADRHEAAAFVAALSRAALAPFRAGPTDVPAEIWVAPWTGGARRVLMNATAAAVATAVFHLPKGAEVVESPLVDAQLAFLAGHVPAMGVSDVLAIL